VIKRIIEISSRPAHLSIRHGQILISYKDGDNEVNTVPTEDVGLVCVDEQQTTYTHRFLVAMAESGVAIVICSAKHLPVSILTPESSHSQIQQRIEGQVKLSRPMIKKLWREIVREKIKNQSDCLPNDYPEKTKLHTIIRQLKSGDVSNGEGQAAKVYWKAMSKHFSGFQGRDTDGQDSINSFLNYGYTVLRAAVAREIVLTGLNPVLGLFHRGRSNAFALADDLMEPYRPWVDRAAFALHENGTTQICTEAKSALIGTLFETVRFSDCESPLWVGIRRTVKSFGSVVDGNGETILYPNPSVKWN